MEKNSKEIQKKLITVKYDCDNMSHLIVNQEICSNCREKTCTFICPADVYNIDDSMGNVVVQYENCLECGACKIACPKNNIDWRYPKSSYGVVFKNS
ncbi:4Fe-4S dicluster domain-containing protein [bacterium]|nr:4Fe-4S dicluster domain-containing protein [bacterium]